VREAAEGTYALARQLQDPCGEGLAAKTIGLTHLAEGERKTALEWMKNAGTLCRRIRTSGSRSMPSLPKPGPLWTSATPIALRLWPRRAVEVAAKGNMDDLRARALRLLDSAT
jgi:hypothetical protein